MTVRGPSILVCRSLPVRAVFSGADMIESGRALGRGGGGNALDRPAHPFFFYGWRNGSSTPVVLLIRLSFALALASSSEFACFLRRANNKEWISNLSLERHNTEARSPQRGRRHQSSDSRSFHFRLLLLYLSDGPEPQS